MNYNKFETISSTLFLHFCKDAIFLQKCKIITKSRIFYDFNANFLLFKIKKFLSICDRRNYIKYRLTVDASNKLFS